MLLKATLNTLCMLLKATLNILCQVCVVYDNTYADSDATTEAHMCGEQTCGQYL